MLGQYSQNSLEYTKAMIPVIVQLGLMLLVVLVAMYALARDLVDNGCLAWHRDSVGYLLQALVAYICLLVTSINLMHYIAQFEHDDVPLE